ncbi:glycosyl hydrolase [Niabella hibiscisoli]|uniref:glycosyl hydrolase n=1 Tax=Niabella hibiscisoli TaxID=1825928 RepID=UPI0021D4096E|nr:glycosyl hydrolase [Niabella hibiscisoli]
MRRDSADIRNVDPDPNMLKFASSAAHAYGKPLTSCETFTWLSEHFKTSWSQCKPEVDQVFLSGINHVFYHGTTYSPADAKWPGWLFYASVNFVPNNSLWPHLKGLNDYIAHCQSVLQAGMPDNELAIYWPVYDIWHNAKGMDKPLSVHHVDDWLHPTAFYKNLVSLQNEGYALDFVSDKMLEQAKANGTQFGIAPKGGQHKALLVPAAEKMPVATFKNIVRLASEGASVVIEQFPKDVPGYKDVEQQRQELKRLIDGLSFSENNKLKLAAVDKGKIIVGNMHDALAHLKIDREAIADNGLKFIRRKLSDAHYYFIVNNTANDFDKAITLQNSAATVLVMDPVSGLVNKVAHQNDNATTGFRLQLKSGASVIIKLTDKKEEATAYKYSEPAGEAIQLQNNKWTLSFKEGGPELPATRQLAGVKPWTDFTNDPRTQAFSGTGVYTTSFVLKNKAADYLLQLDQLYESARIIVNGKDAGLIWSLPFEKGSANI